MGPREQAAFDGKKFYRTGIPCKNGHDGNRYVSTGNCVQCSELRRNNYKQYRMQNSEFVTMAHLEHRVMLRRLTDALLRKDPRAVAMLTLFDAGQPKGRT